MFGCGETTCTTNSTTSMDCDETENCGECLSLGCAWAPVEGCLESCEIIADTACYTSTSTASVEDICLSSQESEMDEKRCMEQTTCTTCVSTTLADSSSNCQWFEDGMYCSSSCGMDGCGTNTCSGSDTTFVSQSPTLAPSGSGYDSGIGLTVFVSTVALMCFLYQL
jgi:hypothetical protein